MGDNSGCIAIVDDDPFVLRALERLLRARALKVRTYTSARDFLTSLPLGVPVCLIVDLQMPEMSGLELQHQLTRSGIWIPTIVITAHNEASARERCEAAGCAAFLTKPLQPASLLIAIETATTRRCKRHP
ncbi:response regulator [Bradyrhizobium sp. F1.13.3]|uniref:response regulator transcription factor n=1 Tax=Bradyrhizobium sp. F1.13.3 TaxID=3156351 RepID=UPI00339B99FC